MDVSDPIIVSLGISMGIQLLFFIFAFSFKTDKVTDLSYGLTFIAIAWYWFLQSGGSLSGSRLVLTIMITLWGIRLSTYLLIRIFKTGRDTRFDDKRDNLVKFGKFWFLQGVAVWVIMLPAVYVLSGSNIPELGLVPLLGVYLWAAGMCIETVADYQLYAFRFKKSKETKEHPWIDEGLWHYSRHPNYFGEIMLWWGVFVYGITVYDGFGWLVVAGPLFITLLLMYGSGVPILEKANDKRWGGQKAYQQHKAATSLLVPLPKKNVKRTRQSV